MTSQRRAWQDVGTVGTLAITCSYNWGWKAPARLRALPKPDDPLAPARLLVRQTHLSRGGRSGAKRSGLLVVLQKTEQCPDLLTSRSAQFLSRPAGS